MLPQCRDMGVGVIPWSPLARGVLARPPAERSATTRGASDHFTPTLYGDEAEPAILDAVGVVAARHGVSRAQVALAWLLHHPAVTAPIVGVTKAAHLADAVAATAVALTPDDLDALSAPYRPRRVLGHS